MNTTLKDRLRAEIDARRDDLVQLTQDLIRIPTVNPPGDHYREICDYVDRRLSAHGYATELLRAEGAPGLHFYTMNQSVATLALLERLGWGE